MAPMVLPSLELPVSVAIVVGVGTAALGVAAFVQARRWRAERRRLFDAEHAFHAMTTGVVDFAVLLLDPDGRILSWNEAARRIEGYTDREIVGCHFSAFYPVEDRAAGKPALMLDTARREGRSRDEGWRVRRDGSRFWAEVLVTAVRRADGTLHGFVKATRDLTERRRAEDAARMELLSRRFLEADEARRRHLARELLDAIGAALAGARANIKDVLARGDDEALREAARLVEQATAQSRFMATSLRPPMLDDAGLAEALRWAVQRQAPEGGPRAELQLTDLDARLPPEIETACFRICEEALSNAVRHSGARHVNVAARRVGPEVELEVTDDGVGFEPELLGRAAEAGRHFGIVAMAGRAELAGGHLEIHSQPGAGTRVRLVRPAAGRRQHAMG